MKKIAAVFDTNVFISAILFGGNSRTCLELAREGKIILYASRVILLETADKLSGKFRWNEEEIGEVIRGIGVFASIVAPKAKIGIIRADESDNRILECAIEARADYIVSGDKKHILPLKEYEGIRIRNPKQFLDIHNTK